MKKLLTFVIATIAFCTTALCQETLEEFQAEVEAAVNKKSSEAIRALYYTKGQPKALTDAMEPMLAIFERKGLNASKPKIFTIKEYTPKMKLPGKIQDKELEFLVAPTHWVIIHIASPEGANPKINFDLTLPAAKVEGVWKISGVKYK